MGFSLRRSGEGGKEGKGNAFQRNGKTGNKKQKKMNEKKRKNERDA